MKKFIIIIHHHIHDHYTWSSNLISILPENMSRTNIESFTMLCQHGIPGIPYRCIKGQRIFFGIQKKCTGISFVKVLGNIDNQVQHHFYCIFLSNASIVLKKSNYLNFKFKVTFFVFLFVIIVRIVYCN